MGTINTVEQYDPTERCGLKAAVEVMRMRHKISVVILYSARW